MHAATSLNNECPAIPLEFASEKEIRGEISKDVSIHNCIVESSIHVNCICLTVKFTRLGHVMLLSSQHACQQFSFLKPHVGIRGRHSQQSIDTALQSPKTTGFLYLLALRLYGSMIIFVFTLCLTKYSQYPNFGSEHT